MIVLSIILKTIKSAASTTAGNFDEFKIGGGGLHEKLAVATWNFRTISAFA
jgi:hypothetical protein